MIRQATDATVNRKNRPKLKYRGCPPRSDHAAGDAFPPGAGRLSVDAALFNSMSAPGYGDPNSFGVPYRAFGPPAPQAGRS